MTSEAHYRPAWWIPGRHLRTVWGRIFRSRPILPTHLERWDVPDGDFLELVRLGAPAGRPRLLILHGLEGGPRSHYALGLLQQAKLRNWAADVLVFRSCGTELNRALRFYHSGETSDLELVVERLTAAEPGRSLVLAGVSLGGNVLLKWLGERGRDLPVQLRGAATVSVPYDLARGSRFISHGLARMYEAHFLRSLRRKAHAKRARYPGVLHAEDIDRARSLYDFDDKVTAPLHGFRDAGDYYTRSSSIRWLAQIALPTLLLSAVDDPFLPPEVLEEVRTIARGNTALRLEVVDRGGHVGFIAGRVPWRPVYYAERRVVQFLEHCLGQDAEYAASG